MSSYDFLMKAALITAAFGVSAAMASDIEINQPAVRAMPPGAPASGAYVTLINHSDHERYIVDVESNAADTVEVHVSEMQGDTMKMYRVEQIAIPAHGQATLTPGGYHIMMIGLTKPLAAGDQVTFTLVMKNGERIAMQAPVLSPDDMASYMPSGMGMDHSKMDHGNMSHHEMKHGEMSSEHSKKHH